MELNKGMLSMIGSVIKALGMDPVKVQSAMDQIAKSIHNASVELQAIRRQQDYILSQNRAIMAHFKIEVQDDGQQQPQFALNGSERSDGTRTNDAGAGN